MDLPSYPTSCPGHESWDVTGAVNTAVLAGLPTVTIELRVPAGSEHEWRYGRRFSTAAVLNVRSDRLPVVADLRVGGASCGAQPVYTSDPLPGVSVGVIDPDPVTSAVEFAIAHGGTGVVGSFTFDAHGDPDVVAFRWGMLPGGPSATVPAGQPGGTATVQWTPAAPGPAHLVVLGVDRAGNTSPQAQYDFVVATNAPTVEDHNPDAGFGQPRTITFHPNLPGVTAYVYTFNSPTPHTIGAGADGTATVVLVFNSAGGNSLYTYTFIAG